MLFSSAQEHPDVGPLNLAAYLLEPVQRIPRYKLLLQGAFDEVVAVAVAAVLVQVR